MPFLRKGITVRKRPNANVKPRTKSIGAMSVWSVLVPNRMGWLIRSENSLNQHIKLKHSELWEKLKIVENEPGKKFTEEIQIGNAEEKGNKDNEIVF